MVWVIAFGELFFGDLWCVVWGYGGMRTHFSLLNPSLARNLVRNLARNSRVETRVKIPTLTQRAPRVVT